LKYLLIELVCLNWSLLNQYPIFEVSALSIIAVLR